METCCPLFRYWLLLLQVLLFNLYFYNLFPFRIQLNDHLCFVQASGQQIPVVVQSCVCFINLNGKCMNVGTQ